MGEIGQMKKAIIAALGLLFQASGLIHGGQMNTGMDSVNYGRPFEPPTRPAFMALPPGAVEPAGWLRDWCLTARDGYTGHMDEIDSAFRQAWAADYRMTGEKLFWDKGGWPYEGGGYWLDGLVRLGYVLHDETLINQAKARLDQVVTNMNDKGILFMWWLDRNNPDDLKWAEGRANRETEWPMWANGLMGRALTGYYAGSGDQRVLRAMETAYSGERRWVRMGWAPANLAPAFDTYTWTGNKAIQEALNELFVNGGENKGVWSWDRYGKRPNDNPWVDTTDHGVHLLESTTWALGYLWTGQKEFLDAALGWHANLARDGMQPQGVPVFDEFSGPPGVARCTETCDVAGFMWSEIFLLTVSGQGVLGDRVERAFFNAAPAVVTRDFKEHVYLQSPNRMSISPEHGQQVYQRKHFPLCCTAALNRMLPNYVSHMWMATYDNGLAAAHYGPCQVSALVADRVRVELVCRTDYPFNETIDISVKPAREAKFPLSFRIPGWCDKPVLEVNGAAVKSVAGPGGFVRIERFWKAGDAIRLRFPMCVRVDMGRDVGLPPAQQHEVLDARVRERLATAAPYATVSYGPLLFALPIADTKDANTPDPAAKWNYALDVPGGKPGSDIVVDRNPMPEKWYWPFASPLKLRAHALSFDWKPTPEASLPSTPIPSQKDTRPDEITLIPYGCTKFRIAMMPVTERTFELLDKERTR